MASLKAGLLQIQVSRNITENLKKCCGKTDFKPCCQKHFHPRGVKEMTLLKISKEENIKKKLSQNGFIEKGKDNFAAKKCGK